MKYNEHSKGNVNVNVNNNNNNGIQIHVCDHNIHCIITMNRGLS